jgi:nucleotide-binding universal stress UspA family protein
MTIQRILVAYDGSPHSKKALDWGLNMAKQTTASLHLVMVFERNIYHTDLPTHLDDLEKTYMELFQMKLDTALDACRDSGIPVSGEVCNGHITDLIIKKSLAWQADMIVCGTRGHGGFANVLIGSVAHALVTYSEVPVVVIK